MQYPIKATHNVESQKLPPPLKEYICFQTDRRSVWKVQWAKSIALTNVVDKITSI